MEAEKFYNLIENDILPKCMSIMKSKGESYSGLEDRLGNFKRCAKLAGVTTEQAWLTYFVKHLDAISAFVRGEYKDSEPIEGRIQDCINYMFLLYGILAEEGKIA